MPNLKLIVNKHSYESPYVSPQLETPAELYESQMSFNESSTVYIITFIQPEWILKMWLISIARDLIPLMLSKWLTWVEYDNREECLILGAPQLIDA